MVGLYDGRHYQVFVDGDNLLDLSRHLQKYSVVVTFNGSGFDLRFLRLTFPDLRFPPIHIDLHWVTPRLGMKGGLKEVESKLGLRSAAEIEDLTGYDATVLWAKHLRGDKKALESVIQYNTDDVVHLKAIMEVAYDKLSRQTGGFLKDSVPSIFRGISEPPKPRRRGKHGVPATNPTGATPGQMFRHREGAARCWYRSHGQCERATGWALMQGSDTLTKSLSTDDDLIKETIAPQPDLVSIDSPLSLPEGWQDPATPCGQPIYRKCELALKRMGISVFWCLLPTMKCLTTRGMRLARSFREAGL
jgi:hypothetical protein